MDDRRSHLVGRHRNRRLGWALIGASSFARDYMIDAIRADRDNQVVAVMSRSRTRAARFAREHGIRAAYDSLDAVVSDENVQVAYVSTTNELHASATIAAAKAGRHVLCEKPLATNLADAMAMDAACAESGVVLGVNHHLRGATTYRAVRTLLTDGRIGTPIAARVCWASPLPAALQTWRVSDPSAGAGVTLDLTVHDADLLRFVLDDDVAEVAAIATSSSMSIHSIDDSVMSVMRFHRDLLACAHESFVVPHATPGLEIHGTDGSLIARDTMTAAPVGEVYLRRGKRIERLDLGRRENAYTVTVRRFVDAIRGIGLPVAIGDDGIRAVAVALAVLRSASNGVRVRPPDLLAEHPD